MTSVPRLPLPFRLLLALSLGLLAASCSAQVPSPPVAPDYAHAPTLTGLMHWSRLPVRVFVATHSPEEEQEARDTLAGFDAWVKATGGVLRYLVVNAPGAANIVVRLRPPSRCRGRTARSA